MRKLFYVAVGVVVMSCNGIKNLKSAFIKRSPYEHYVQRLEDANLHQTALASSWIDAGKKSFQDSISISLPFTESGSFQSSIPEARSYSFTVKDGQVLKIEGQMKSSQRASMFLDLFVRVDTSWMPVAHGDSAFQLSYEFQKDQQCLIRIQPELLVTAYYALTVTLTPVLINPVCGASNRSIGSFYGDTRDDGKRRHEGVDIFAPKGTPVIAPAAGKVTRVGTSTLGGKVIWLQDAKRGNAYYFAHLDEQFVAVGKYVKQGDTLGNVGNTGNARFTPSHLHFGIYQTKSINPLHYILTMDQLDGTSPLDTTLNDQPYRIKVNNTALRVGPDHKNAIRQRLNKDTYVRILGQSKSWYRVALADRRQGFLAKDVVISATKGKRMRLKTEATLLSESNPQSAPLGFLQQSAIVEILARHQNFDLVKTDAGKIGWLMSF